jgi:hypothetical protein
LIDWTYSFFAAVYFALEKVKPGATPVVWAIDADWLLHECLRLVRGRIRRGFSLLNEHINERTPRSFESLFMKNRAKFVFLAVPFRLNERLSAQQGAFLCAGKVTEPFETNLAALANADDHIIQVQLGVTKEFRQEILNHLFRMNIYGSTLFPDLSGFARSLSTRAPILDLIRDRR